MPLVNQSERRRFPAFSACHDCRCTEGALCWSPWLYYCYYGNYDSILFPFPSAELHLPPCHLVVCDTRSVHAPRRSVAAGGGSQNRQRRPRGGLAARQREAGSAEGRHREGPRRPHGRRVARRASFSGQHTHTPRRRDFVFVQTRHAGHDARPWHDAAPGAEGARWRAHPGCRRDCGDHGHDNHD